MITAVVKGHVKRNQEGAFHEGVRKAMKEAGPIDGLRYLKFARRFEDDGREQFILIAEYESSSAMHAAMAAPRLRDYSFLGEMVEDYEVNFWEAVDVDFDPETALPIYPSFAAVAP